LAWGEHRCFVVEAVRSLLNHTKHRNIEIVIVFDRSTPATVLEQLRGIGGNRIVLEEFDAPFNFSDKCNRGFLASSGDVVVFLNDDVEIQSEDFIEQLCAPLEEESVGMTGARLNYSDGSIQHAGLIMQDTEFVHAYLAQPGESFGFFGELVVDHEVSGLTAACVALRRDVVKEVGGFRLDLPSNFNDVDFSYKVRAAGYRLLWLHDVRATHFESQTRKNTVFGWEVQAILDRWGKPSHDPYMPMEADRVVALLERQHSKKREA
jgi:GT2 family glycosyltransferase